MAADFPSGRKALPSCKSSASYLPGSPSGEHLSDGGLIDAEDDRVKGFRLGARVMIAADVKIAVGPAVQPVADSWSEGVVHCRVAQRTLDAPSTGDCSFSH